MQVEVVLPKVGMAMQDAVIVSWLKNEGDSIKKDEPLFEMETEKVVETVNSPETGIIEEIKFAEGDTVDVDTVVAIIRVSDSGSAESASKPSTAPAAAEEKKAAQTEKTGNDEKGLGSSIPLSRMRQTISKRMSESLLKSAQLTLMRETDVTKTVEKREASLKSQGITYTDILTFVVAKEISRYPMINSRLEEDKLVINPKVNIGIAVAIDDGLVVPVIKDANKKSLVEIAAERKRLVDAVRSGTYTIDDLSEGTFTITNLGTYGIDNFTPIINLPEVAILGVGQIVKKPVVVDDTVKIHSMMGLSLTIDHRVIDGAPGAEFLAKVNDALANADY